jgi:long-chain acyl-CoA synthetase
VRGEPRRLGEEDIYPHWPWWWPVRLLRVAYLELVSQPFVWFFAKPRVERPQHLQPEGPALIVANHVTAYDLALILYGLPRPMRRRVTAAMAGNMLRDFRHMRNVGPQGRAVTPFLDVLGPAAWLLITALYNVFPLPRSAGFRRSFQHAGEALDRGYNVVVFPEGFRTETGLQPFRPGIGLLVHESAAPVVPVALVGLSELKQRGHGWFRSGKLIVRVGEPIPFDPNDSPEQITNRLYETLKSMLEKG